MPAKIDPRVDVQIAKSGAFAQPVLRHLRSLVHLACPEVEESIKWSHISFAHRGQILAMMAAFKTHLSFGFWHHKMTGVLARDGYYGDSAMGSMGRITGLADLPDDKAMLRYLRTAMELNESGAPARRPRKPKPKIPLRIPADLSAGLRKNKKAAATWEIFTQAKRRDYLDWLAEAKRDETRVKRLASTLEWLAAGKIRNWKYLNC